MSVVRVETPKEIAVATPETVKVTTEKKNNRFFGVAQASSGPQSLEDLAAMLEEAFAPVVPLWTEEMPFFGMTSLPPTTVRRPPPPPLELSNRFQVLTRREPVVASAAVEGDEIDLDELMYDEYVWAEPVPIYCDRSLTGERLEELTAKAKQYMRSFRYEGCGNVTFEPDLMHWFLHEEDGVEYIYTDDDDFTEEYAPRWSDVQRKINRRRARVEKKRQDAVDELEFEDAEIWNRCCQIARTYDVCLKYGRGAAEEFWSSELVERVEQVERVRRLRSKRSLGPFYRRCLRKSKEQKKLKLEGVAQSMFDALKDMNINGKLDVGRIDVSHVLTIPGVAELVAHLTKTSDAKVDWKQFVVQSAFFLGHLYQGGLTVSNLMLSAGHFLASVGLSSLMSVFERIRRPKAQSGLNVALGVLSTAIAGIISVVSVLAISKLPTDKTIDQFINRFSRIGGCLTSSGKIFDLSSKAAEYTLDFIKKHFFGLDSSDLKEFEAIDAFCDEVQQLNTVDLEQRCENERDELAQQVTSWLQRADEIQKQLDAVRMPALSCGRFRSTCLFLVKARDKLAGVAAGIQRARIAPLFLHFYGNTGVGKSSTLDYLNSRILVALGSKDPADLQNKVYYRNPMSQFYDGFRNGTEIIVNDDFGAMRDSEVHPSPEPIDAIRQGNTAPFKPPMADLTGKANAIFEAKVVIWTSNRSEFNFPSLTNPDAVKNRVELRFKQYPHPDFQLVKQIGNESVVTLDSHKVATAAMTDPEVWRKCLLFDQENATGAVNTATGRHELIQGGLTFDDMSEIVLAALRTKQGLGANMRKERLEYFKKCVAEAQAGDESERVVQYQRAFFNTQPGFLGRLFGKKIHLDVLKTVAEERCFVGDRARARDLTEQEQKICLIHCVECDPSEVRQTADWFCRFYRAIYEGDDTDELICEYQMGHNVKQCVDAHDNVPVFNHLWKKYGDATRKFVSMSTVEKAKAYVSFKQHPFVASLMAIVSVGVIGSAIALGIRWLLKDVTPDDVETEAYAKGLKAVPAAQVEQYGRGIAVPPTNKTEAYPSATARVAPVTRVEAEGIAESVSDQNADEVRRRVAQNMYHILTGPTADAPMKAIGSLTVIKGRVAITNRHITALFDKFVKIRSTVFGRREYVFESSLLNMAHVPDEDSVYGQRDVAVMELPLNVHIHASLLDHFMTADDFSRHVEPRRVSLVKYLLSGGETVLTYQETDKCRAFDSDVFKMQNNNEETLSVRGFYLYAMETKGGDCGGLVVSFDPRFNRKICAMHMAGGSMGQGYTAAGVALPRGFIDRLVAELKLKHRHSFFNGEVPVPSPIVPIAKDGLITCEAQMDGLVLSGKVNAPVYQARTSAISPSPVHDICGPVLKRPALLTRTHTEDGVLDPMALAMMKVRTPSLLMDPSALRSAVADVKAMVCIPSEDARTLTFDEAVRGIEGNTRYPAINRSTSPGYGWVKRGKGKEHYLGCGEFVILPEVREEYEKTLARLKDGLRAGHYWTDTLKDELRPIERVLAGKTRLFSAGEMVQTILLRQFFMGFSAHMDAHAIEYESCVGVNPYSMDWTAIALKLQKKGPQVVAGDFSNYDGTLPADGLWAVLEVVNSFYDTPEERENNEIRALLWCEIVNSVHVQGTTVYQWTHSQPSGCPFTSILNSVFHSIAVRVCYLLAARKYSPADATMSAFHRHVTHVNYGDDDVTNVSLEAGWFNQQTMAEQYATFGMTYTDEAKSGELVKFRKLSEIQFLKRAFVFDEAQARYFAPLDINTIREMPCWNKTKGDQYTLTALVLEDAVYELAQHPREVFDAEIGNFLRARAAIAPRVEVHLSSFEDLRAVDAWKYAGPGAVAQEKPCDRGLGLMTVRSEAANPATVARNSATCEPEGGVFTPSGECVPSENNRLFALSATPQPESAGGSRTRLYNALPTSRRELYQSLTPEERKDYKAFVILADDKPTMCRESFVYKDPLIADQYSVVDSCPCDFHSGSDTDCFRRIFDRWCIVVGKAYDTVDLHGVTQAGEEESGTDANPNFAGGAAHAEEHQVMTFEHDGDVEDPERQMDAPMVKAVSAPAEDALVNELKDFLRRPVHMRDFVWPRTTVPSAQVTPSISLPGEWLTKPMIREKLAGFRYMRCTLVVEVQVNAQPMNQGGLMPFFHPVESQLSFRPSSSGHFGGIMGYPHVLHRLGESTASRLRIPFFPLVSHFDLVKGFGTMGSVHIPVYSALDGSDDCDGSVFIWAEDVDVSMPTGLPIVLAGRAQAGGAAAERKRPGTVETAAKVAGQVAGALGSVPGLGGIASVASTVLGGVGSLASAFGWSKPIDPEYTQEVGMMFGRNMQNHNGDAKPKVMALDARNTCNIPTAVFNTTDDEMAFSVFFRQPIHTDRFTYAGTQAQGSLIHKWPADPSACVKRVMTIGTDTVCFRQENNLSYLMSCGRYWRGGLIFCYKFFKTDFHSGRLRFTYVPGATLDTDFSTIDINKCYSQVHDMRATKDVEFVVPYNFLQPWKATDDLEVGGDRDILDWSKPCYEVPQGMVYVSVVNALRNPTTVASTVEVCLWVSADDDFQLAVPYASSDLRIITRADSMPSFAFSGLAQAGAMFETTKVREEVNASSIGEVFTGFRQWLKRYHLYDGTDTFQSRERVFVVDRASFPTEHTLASDLAKKCGPFRRAAVLYRFQCGSMRILKPESEPKTYNATSFPGAPTFHETSNSTGLALATTSSSEPLMEFEVPFYQPFVALLTDLGYPAFADDDASGLPYTRLPYNVGSRLEIAPSPNSSVPLYRAIGETFSYGYRLGVPITAVPTGIPPPTKR